MHSTPLVATIVIGLSLAFVFGTLANRLRIPPLAGYLLAGVFVGPFTPGYIADAGLAHELSELGVILLMFGVGLHFSLKDLLSVRKIAIPGAIAQIVLATLMGMALAWWFGWSFGAGFVFGLALSVASTVVLLRALQERHLIESEKGRIAVGWLIVEDIAMVLALVMIPALSPLMGGQAEPGSNGGTDIGAIATTVGITIGKLIAFVALMLIVGRRVIPWILHYVAHTGSRELFRLAVLAIALGVAFGAAQLFGVSFALGAFFAGMILSESQLSQRAAEESLPLRDAFAVLFFVSVGMLFDPAILWEDTLAVLAVVLIILVGKSAAAFLIVCAFRYPIGTAMMISASLAQIGEFSFILAGLGVDLGLMPERGRDLILAGALISILINPFTFTINEWLLPYLTKGEPTPKEVEPEEEAPLHQTPLVGHSVVVGYGRVGSFVGRVLKERGEDFLVIEDGDKAVITLRQEGTEVLAGNAVKENVLEAANVLGAKRMFIAIPNCFEAGQVIEQARNVNPTIEIIARAHSDAEVEYLESLGADCVIMGEREIARGMVDHAFGQDMYPALP